ncbi:nucleoside deaminase [Peribacillus alkalitolerans]|uniref:nucleoside deaminase n=1 Tax=Peribacillus alkalitolerans TaxID=1550385 RepID=UPI0013D4A87B|nr:nucleoside deaminase [Peribacillus alkalitolerans]
MGDKKLMEKAVELAQKNVVANHGGPFGAIVVKDGQIISVGRNEVTATNDPTAHAEVQAIRAACKTLNSFQLTDCEIYTSCEPCPMCIGAIYWARPKAVYYACTKSDAALIGFDDQFIYDQIALPIDKREINMIQVCSDHYDLPFHTWNSSTKKTEY